MYTITEKRVDADKKFYATRQGYKKLFYIMDGDEPIDCFEKRQDAELYLKQLWMVEVEGK